LGTEAPEKKDDAFDVVMMHGATDDGAGTKVLRARPGRIEAGEVRPMAEGRPLAAGGEVVRLERRPDAPALFDVHVEYEVPQSKPDSTPALKGPAQVATHAYRESWDRTFGAN
jgi:N-acyl-D-aspartate/D-glutamate deacylase